MHSANLNDNSNVLLTTVEFLIEDYLNVPFKTRGFLDSGSQTNLITQELCDQLKLNTKPINWKLTGIMGLNGQCTKIVNIRIQSLYDKSSFSITCLVVPTITNCLPTVYLDPSLFTTPYNNLLADKEFYKPGNVHLLLGADIFGTFSKATEFVTQTILRYITKRQNSGIL